MRFCVDTCEIVFLAKNCLANKKFTVPLTTPLPRFLTAHGRYVLLPICAIMTVEFSVENTASDLLDDRRREEWWPVREERTFASEEAAGMGVGCFSCL